MKKVLLGLWAFFSICLAGGDPTEGVTIIGQIAWMTFCFGMAYIAGRLLQKEYSKHPDNEQV